MFTYQCGFIRWTRNSAGVGFNSDTAYNNHPLSITNNIINIDCYDTVSGWTNIVYKINEGITAMCQLFINLCILLFPL